MNRITTLLSRTATSQDGSVTVEFIVTLPVLLAALAFCYELGRAFLAYEIASADVQLAVRYLARSNVAACAQVNASSCAAVSQAENVAKCGAPNCSDPHWPWNDYETGTPPVFNSDIDDSTTVPFLILCDKSTNKWCVQYAPNGQAVYPFNQDVSVVQLDAHIPVALKLLGYIGAGHVYTMRIVDQAMLIGN